MLNNQSKCPRCGKMLYVRYGKQEPHKCVYNDETINGRQISHYTVDDDIPITILSSWESDYSNIANDITSDYSSSDSSSTDIGGGGDFGGGGSSGDW